MLKHILPLSQRQEPLEKGGGGGVTGKSNVHKRCHRSQEKNKMGGKKLGEKREG